MLMCFRLDLIMGDKVINTRKNKNKRIILKGISEEN
jgi:hypothetical protein